MSMSERERAALRAEYTREARTLRGMLTDAIVPILTGLGSWRDRDLDDYLEQVLPVALGAQDAMARLTDYYLSARLADRFGEPSSPLGLEAVPAVRGVDPEEVYARPFAQMWTDLSRGHPLTLAVQHGAQRLESIAVTDVQLQRTHAARSRMMADDRVSGYRRVPRGGESCALCLIASTQQYSKEDLAAIHPGCHCDVAEVVGDPRQVVDRDLLDQVHDAVERDLGPQYVDFSGRSTDYRRIMVVREHGELGPTLSVSDHQFTGPDDV